MLQRRHIPKTDLFKMRYLTYIALAMAALYFSSCEDGMSEAQEAYDTVNLTVDSLENIYEENAGLLGDLMAKKDNLMDDMRNMEAVDSTALMNLQEVDNTLAEQQTVLESVEGKFDEFDDLDMLSTTPEMVMEKVENMKGELGDIGNRLSGVNETLNTVSGTLNMIQEKMTATMMTVTEE